MRERKVVFSSKSIQLGSELGNAMFPLGLKLKLTLLGADELNLQSVKPLSFASWAALFLWLWKRALFQWFTPAVFSKSCLFSKDKTPAMLLLACCNSYAGQQMINKNLLYNINKLSALLSTACCHQSKSCVSKALICESLFSYLASFSIQTLLSCCNKNICLFFQ